MSGSMVVGMMQPELFHCLPSVAPGNKIVSELGNPIYLPVSNDVINEINIWVTDQDNNLLDLQEEKTMIKPTWCGGGALCPPPGFENCRHSKF